MNVRTIVSAALATVALLAATGGAAMAAGGPAARSFPIERTDAPGATVPPGIQVPVGNLLTADFLGKGVQVYQCTAGAWTFLEPAAGLIGWSKRPSNFAAAVHFRGPSWQSTNDGSLVEARVLASSPVTGSIPQLLLQATKNRGDGLFGNVSYIQRLATRGGTAPTGTCTDGQTTGVPYESRYRFFVPAN